MRPNPTRSSPRLRAVVLSLLFIGALTVIASCSGGTEVSDTAARAEATHADLGGTDVLVHHAVG